MVKIFAKNYSILISKSPSAARQLKFLQICYHTSNGPMNHTIPQVGGHMAATADLYDKKNMKVLKICGIQICLKF